MTIDLSQLNMYYIVALPGIVAFVAGLIRQDKLPQAVNEALSLVIVLILAAIQALLGGKLGGGTLTDFAIITSYAAALVHTPPLAALQQYLQSNLLSFGKPVASAQPGQPAAGPPTVQIDVPVLAQQILGQINLPQLAVLLSNELMKTANTPPAPQVSDLPTSPRIPVVKVNTPPPNKAG